MRIALLSSGPSLHRFRAESVERFALRIGVNRAACFAPCDWWSVGDEQTIRRHAPAHVRFGARYDEEIRQEVVSAPLPAILTMMPAMEAIALQNPEYFRSVPRWMTWEQLRDSLGDLPATAFDYSAPLALALAVELGATEVECFGVDMAGGSDFTGERHSRFRDHRWKKELAVWAAVQKWAIARGVSVTRAGSMEAIPC